MRLLLVEPAPGDEVIRGGIGFRLMPGYKTYWRSPGDSGVPPCLISQAPMGQAISRCAFPCLRASMMARVGRPGATRATSSCRFGQKARKRSRFPDIEARFCGVRHDVHPAGREPSSRGWIPDRARCDRGHRPGRGTRSEALAAPDFAGRVRLVRKEAGERPVFTLEIRHDAAAEDFAIFTESRGYLHIKPPVQMAPGRYQVTLKGQPPPGDDKSFGPVRLTFGSKKDPLEGLLDLDGGTTSP